MIQINKKYAIDSDEHQWFVKKWKARAEGTKGYPGLWEADGCYHRTLKATLKSLGNRMLRESNYSSIGAIQANAEEIVETLNLAMGKITTPEIEVVVK